MSDAPKFQMDQTPMLEVTYQCSNPRCGALDVGRFYPGERAFPALMCGTCHAGSGMTLQQMVQHGVGMYPVLEPSVVH